MEQREVCEACGGGALEPIMEVQDKTHLRYEMVRCRQCNLLQISRILSSGQAGQLTWEGAEYTRLPQKRNKMKETLFGKVLSRLPRLGISGGKLLDIGCSFGFLLWPAKERGFEVAGVDLSPYVRQYVKEQLGCPAFATISEARQEGPFDVVTCSETIYYMRHPLEDLQQMREVLRPGGLLVVKTRANRSWIYRLLRWWRGKPLELSYGHPLHDRTCWSYYSFTTFNFHRMLQRAGFEVVATHGEDDPIFLSFKPGRVAVGIGRWIFKVLSPVVRTLSGGRRDPAFGITVYARRPLKDPA